MKTWIITLFLVMFSLPALSNDIYIDQIGDTLDLDITQDGTNNQFGDSTTDVTLAGDDMTFAITQTGNLNVIDATSKGANYTGTWTFTGNPKYCRFKMSQQVVLVNVMTLHLILRQQVTTTHIQSMLVNQQQLITW